MPPCVSAHGRTDCAWKKQTRGCVYYPITIFLSWDVLFRPHVIYSLKCLRWQIEVLHSLVRLVQSTCEGRGWPSHTVDTLTLSLDSEAVWCVGMVCRHGQTSWSLSSSLLHPDVDMSAHEITPDTPKACNSSAI